MASQSLFSALRPRSDDEVLHWLALRLTPGLGARKTLDLITRAGTPMAVFRLSPSTLVAHGLSPAVARAVASGCAFEDATSQHEAMKRHGVNLLTIQDDIYPDLLKQIYDPPPMLFAVGNLSLLQTPSVAIVGTRGPSVYGLSTAEKLAAGLSGAGVTVVSGMARGIDTAAHKGALDAGGGTIAVFGCGIDVTYPAENRSLAARIGRDGLILAEFPMGSPAYPQNFPIRNRIVSGLSYGVVVVEGAQYSGSSVTARLALDQNREVFAVPGNITSKQSFGPNLLIKQGAHLVQDVSDILEALPIPARQRLAQAGAEPPAQAAQVALPFDPSSALRSQLIAIIPVDSTIHLDALLDRLPDFSSSEIIAALFELELAGTVRQLPGKNFAMFATV